MIKIVSNLPVPDAKTNDAIYLVDNRRIAFLFDALHYAKMLAGDSLVTFFYPDTGKNINPLANTKHGALMPVEFINSSLLPLRISDKAGTKKILSLFCIDGFSEPALKRLLGLTQHLSQDWCNKVIVAFPDYDPLIHLNSVQNAKGAYGNSSFVETMEVHCYNPDFRTIRG